MKIRFSLYEVFRCNNTNLFQSKREPRKEILREIIRSIQVKVLRLERYVKAKAPMSAKSEQLIKI